MRGSLLLAWFFSASIAVSAHGIADSVALVTALAVGLAVALVVCAIQADGDLAAASVRVRWVALRECARRAAFLRLRDPSAPGRARPRAPSVRSTAA